jgi:hypothetical protein
LALGQQRLDIRSLIVHRPPLEGELQRPSIETLRDLKSREVEQCGHHIDPAADNGRDAARRDAGASHDERHP